MIPVTHHIAYLSPTGMTRRVTGVIAEALGRSGCRAEVLDLGGDGRDVEPSEWLRGVPGPACVWIGSPVYALHPIPQISRFVAGLPVLRRGFAVPFVTWGSVTSGTALWDLGVGLAARGYAPMGAAAVPTEHCTFWKSPDPPGAGRPDHNDLTRVEGLVEAVLERLTADGPLLAPEALDYQTPEIRAVAEEASLEKRKAQLPPRAVMEERCTLCGVCATACPVGAIDLAPYPRFAPSCMLCNECVRACPEDAIPFDADAATTRIRGLAARFREEVATRVFL